jgi:hypothetical protein
MAAYRARLAERGEKQAAAEIEETLKTFWDNGI